MHLVPYSFVQCDSNIAVNAAVYFLSTVPLWAIDVHGNVVICLQAVAVRNQIQLTITD